MAGIRTYWQNWLKRRFQIVEKKQLAQRDILVFFNKEGYLYLILLLITFVAGINYGNNLILALCFLLASVLVLSFYLAFKQLYGLKLHYDVPQLGQVDQPLVLKFTFSPLKQHLHLHLRCEYLGSFKKISLLKEPLTLSFQTAPSQRGQFQVPRLYFYSVYPFGIIRAWSYLYFNHAVWIAPKPLEVNLAHFGFNRHQQDQKKGMEDFNHLRKFVQGDSLNRVAWQQLAKGRGLLVKEFEEYEQQHLHFDYKDMPAHLHEEKLSQLMYLIQHAHEQQTGFSLHLPSDQLKFDRGDAHYSNAQMLLAREP